ADLDRRTTQAAKAARYPRSSTTRWAEALDGPLRDTAQLATQYDEGKKEKAPAPLALEAGDRTWSPAFETYPMWAFAEVSGLDPVTNATGEKSRRKEDRKAARKKKAKPTSTFVVLTREAASEPWRAATSVRVETATLPAPAAG